MLTHLTGKQNKIKNKKLLLTNLWKWDKKKIHKIHT